MNISSIFIHRPVMTCLTMLTLVFFGIIAYRMLPVAAIPTVEYPIIQVTASYPGASAEEMGNLIAAPLERQFILMQGIQVVTSSSNYGSTQIILQFYLDVDMNIAAQEVQQAINRALSELPQDLPQQPLYQKVNPSDTPVIYLVVHSAVLDTATLYDYGYSFIGQQIGTVEGVAQIQIYGNPYAVRIEVDPEAVAAKNLSMTDLAVAINNANPLEPTGKFYGTYDSLTTRVSGQILKAEEYNNIIIKSEKDEIVRLKDIGNAKASLQSNKQKFYWVEKNKAPEEVVVLAIYRSMGHNTVKVCESVLLLVDKLKDMLPSSMEISMPYIQSKWILESVEDVEMTLVVAFILVVLVVFFYLGSFKNSLIPLITLPVTLTGTFIWMYIAGYSIDIFSLSALTLAIGFLVDDAIVVLENIIRWIQEGKNPFEASLNGSKQISITVLSISISLAIVFIPMLFLQGIIGRIFHEFAAVIVISVLFSGLISLSLTPMLCSRFIAKNPLGEESTLEKISEKINRFFILLYQPLLKWAITHKWLVALGCVLITFASCVIFSFMPKTFLPEDDLGVIQSFVVAKEGTSPKQMQEYMKEITDVAIQDPFVRDIIHVDSYPSDNQAISFINLVDSEKRPPISDIIHNFYQKFHNIPGPNVFMKPLPLINFQVGSAQSGKARYQYMMQSFDADLLYQASADLMKKMQTMSEFLNISSDLQPNNPNLGIDILRDKAHMYGGINAKSIESALKYAYGEVYISKINRPENMYYVILQVAPQFMKNAQALSNLYLENEENDTVSIDSVIKTRHFLSPVSINHYNALPSVTLSFDTPKDFPLGLALTALNDAAKQILPSGVMGFVVGDAETFKHSMGQLAFLMSMAIFIVYIILGILYENFLYPIIPMIAVPVGALGALLALWMFGKPLSIYSYIGIIMLLGIVLKNGIIITDFALEEIRDKGVCVQEAVYHACIIRFRPILMTTLAAMMGAIPIALGIGGTVAEGRAPLGIAVVGGLIFSQLVTLLALPVIFILISQLNQWFISHVYLFRDHALENNKI